MACNLNLTMAKGYRRSKLWYFEGEGRCVLRGTRLKLQQDLKCGGDLCAWSISLGLWTSIYPEREREREEGVQSPYIRKCGREQISTWRIWSTALFFMVQLNCQKKKKKGCWNVRRKEVGLAQPVGITTGRCWLSGSGISRFYGTDWLDGHFTFC